MMGKFMNKIDPTTFGKSKTAIRLVDNIKLIDWRNARKATRFVCKYLSLYAALPIKPKVTQSLLNLIKTDWENQLTSWQPFPLENDVKGRIKGLLRERATQIRGKAETLEKYIETRSLQLQPTTDPTYKKKKK